LLKVSGKAVKHARPMVRVIARAVAPFW